MEEIGLRSTRIRGLDGTVTTIPNADFSKMKLTNLTWRDQVLLRFVIRLRYESEPEQVRHVLVGVRKMLLEHPKVTEKPARVRVVGLGETSLNVEVFAYVETTDWNEFVAIREDIILRVLDIVTDSGTALAVPARTVYMTRDSGLDKKRSATAVAEVEGWRNRDELPFPDFDPDFAEEHRDTLGYPPTGSSGQPAKSGKS